MPVPGDSQLLYRVERQRGGRRPRFSPVTHAGCHSGLVQQCNTGTRVRVTGGPTSRHRVQRRPIFPPRCAIRVPCARLPFPRAAAIYDRVARHSKTGFHPRAKNSRSNFPRFDFSKHGFCARHPSKNTPQTDLGFRTSFASVSRVFCDSHPRATFFDTDFRPPIRVENRNRRIPQSSCTWRATNRRRLKRSHQNHPAGGNPNPAVTGLSVPPRTTRPRQFATHRNRSPVSYYGWDAVPRGLRSQIIEFGTLSTGETPCPSQPSPKLPGP